MATLAVDMVAPVAEYLRSIGVEAAVQTVPSGFAVATVSDPDGNTITLAGSGEED